MTAASTKPPPLRGFLQALQPTRIRGWAFAPGEPDVHLRIEVFVDGQPLTQVAASMHFADLEKNGIGRGDHGFLIQLREPVPADEPDRVEVVAVGPGGARRTLPMSQAKRLATAPAAPAPEPKPAPGPGPEPEPEPAKAAVPAAGMRNEAMREHPNADQHPVFILGAARSGTSAMVKALRQTRRYEGFNEGHFLNLLPRLTSAAAEYYTPQEAGRLSPHLPKTGINLNAPPPPSTLLGHTRKPVVMNMLTAGFGEIMRAAHPSLFWFDKTPGPEMIRSAHALARTWPNARFVFMKRRPVDNIESRRRKFPEKSFEENCTLWAECMLAWAAVRGRLGRVSVEVDQAQLVDNPAGVTKRVAAVLGLNEEHAALFLAGLEDENRPQQTGTALVPALTLATVDWTPAMKQQFRDICGEAIAMFGYEADLVDVEAPEPRKEPKKRRKPAAC